MKDVTPYASPYRLFNTLRNKAHLPGENNHNTITKITRLSSRFCLVSLRLKVKQSRFSIIELTDIYISVIPTSVSKASCQWRQITVALSGYHVCSDRPNATVSVNIVVSYDKMQLAQHKSLPLCISSMLSETFYMKLDQVLEAHLQNSVSR